MPPSLISQVGCRSSTLARIRSCERNQKRMVGHWLHKKQHRTLGTRLKADRQSHRALISCLAFPKPLNIIRVKKSKGSPNQQLCPHSMWCGTLPHQRLRPNPISPPCPYHSALTPSFCAPRDVKYGPTKAIVQLVSLV